jgi:hypothetical protein
MAEEKKKEKKEEEEEEEEEKGEVWMPASVSHMDRTKTTMSMIHSMLTC